MFKGLGNLGNIASMVGKLQDIPQKMQELNDQMRSETVSATSECGHIAVTMNGVGEVQSIEIAPDCVTGDDAAAVASHVAHAVQQATNAAGAAAKQRYASAISDMAAELDLPLPGIDGLLSGLTGGAS